MNVQDIINDLQMGEFSELQLGDSSLTTQNLPRFINLIQSALTEFHTKFLIRREELVIQPIEGIVDYPLLKDFALTSKVAGTKFIMDSVYQPFNWKILQVLGAYDELGAEIPINAPNHICGVFISTPASIMIPAPLPARQISLVCRADHNELSGLSSKINIPITMRNALLWFIASRVWATRKDEQAMSKSIQYMQRYLDACTLLSDTGTGVAGDVIDFNYNQRGWR